MLAGRVGNEDEKIKRQRGQPTPPKGEKRKGRHPSILRNPHSLLNHEYRVSVTQLPQSPS